MKKKIRLLKKLNNVNIYIDLRKLCNDLLFPGLHFLDVI